MSDDLKKWCEIISMIPEVIRNYGKISVPQVFFKNKWVGGSDLLSNSEKLENLKNNKLQHIHDRVLITKITDHAKLRKNFTISHFFSFSLS